MQSVRRVVGNSAQGPGDIARLALLAATEAREFGLRVKILRSSRARGSQPSRYLHILDRQCREWCLRIANHYRPQSSPHAPPHFDLVSLDGTRGLGDVRRFLVAISTGEAVWFDRADGGRCRRQRRRPNLKRILKGELVA